MLGENQVEVGRQNNVQEESRVGVFIRLITRYKKKIVRLITALAQKNQNNRDKSKFKQIEYNFVVNSRYTLGKKIKSYTQHRNHTGKYSLRNQKINIKMQDLHAFRKPPHFHHQWSLFNIKWADQTRIDHHIVYKYIV